MSKIILRDLSLQIFFSTVVKNQPFLVLVGLARKPLLFCPLRACVSFKQHFSTACKCMILTKAKRHSTLSLSNLLLHNMPLATTYNPISQALSHIQTTTKTHFYCGEIDARLFPSPQSKKLKISPIKASCIPRTLKTSSCRDANPPPNMTAQYKPAQLKQKEATD